jgi:hypothetical protein
MSEITLRPQTLTPVVCRPVRVRDVGGRPTLSVDVAFSVEISADTVRPEEVLPALHDQAQAQAIGPLMDVIRSDADANPAIRAHRRLKAELVAARQQGEAAAAEIQDLKAAHQRAALGQDEEGSEASAVGLAERLHAIDERLGKASAAQVKARATTEALQNARAQRLTAARGTLDAIIKTRQSEAVNAAKAAGEAAIKSVITTAAPQLLALLQAELAGNATEAFAPLQEDLDGILAGTPTTADAKPTATTPAEPASAEAAPDAESPTTRKTKKTPAAV